MLKKTRAYHVVFGHSMNDKQRNGMLHTTVQPEICKLQREGQAEKGTTPARDKKLDKDAGD
jgi:hypothetical protein